MQKQQCQICRKTFEVNPRRQYCSGTCRWLAWEQKGILEAKQALELPPAVLPADLQAHVPAGPAGQLAALQMILQGRAPAGARGYRVGTSHGRCRLLRWFPSSLRRRLPIFFLDPFEQPLVPVPTLYTVAYMDERGEPIGGPRFTLELTQRDGSVRYCDGDRAMQPRPRGEQ